MHNHTISVFQRFAYISECLKYIHYNTKGLSSSSVDPTYGNTDYSFAFTGYLRPLPCIPSGCTLSVGIATLLLSVLHHPHCL